MGRTVEIRRCQRIHVMENWRMRLVATTVSEMHPIGQPGGRSHSHSDTRLTLVVILHSSWNMVVCNQIVSNNVPRLFSNK